MWQKILVIILLFYFFALLQGSFFIHYNLFGAVPDLVFILFFVLAFFMPKNKSLEIFFLAFLAGILSDIFSFTYLGSSVIIFLIIGFLLKKTQFMLKNKDDNYPFVYFFSLFTSFLAIFIILTDLCLHFVDSSRTPIIFGIGVIFSAIYDLLIASALFFICKRQKFISLR